MVSRIRAPRCVVRAVPAGFSVVERIQAERKRKEKNEEEMLNEELDLAIGELAKGQANMGGQALIDYIEELRTKKSIR